MRIATGLAVAAAALYFAAGGAADAKEDIADLINPLNAAADPATRIALIQRLGATESARAAEVLSGVARRDGDARVRVAAAAALVRMNTDVAYPSLKELFTAGGIREVRRQAAIGMAARPHGLEWTLDRIASGRTDKVERVLLVSALGDFPGLGAAEALEQLADSALPDRGSPPPVICADLDRMRFVARDCPPLRSAAIRALARHDLGRLELPRIAAGVLTRARDPETILAALDACEEAFDREIRDVLPPLLERKDPRITAAVVGISRRIEYLDALDRWSEQRKADEKLRKDGYAPANPASGAPPAPTAPSARPKVDVVFIYDDTASMDVGKVRGVRGLEAAAQEELEPGVSIRHAFVAMQDTVRNAWDPPSQYFPPLFDASMLGDVKWRQPSLGVDTQGIEVGAVLRDTLDRFDWRPGAARRVVIVSDTYVGDPELAQRTARVHRQADGLTLRCPTLRGAEKRSKSWDELAAAANGALSDK